jgi:transcriptional regulator with XRE-family HTH domain
MAGRHRDPVDTLVGRNIRIIRQGRGTSQTELARKIGVTFQQVQKYENGTNRVGAGRLFKIASVFGVPISAMFEGAEEALPEENPTSSVALLAEPYVLRTARALAAVSNEAFRKSVAELAEHVASRMNIAGEPQARREGALGRR